MKCINCWNDTLSMLSYKTFCVLFGCMPCLYWDTKSLPIFHFLLERFDAKTLIILILPRSMQYHHCSLTIYGIKAHLCKVDRQANLAVWITEWGWHNGQLQVLYLSHWQIINKWPTTLHKHPSPQTTQSVSIQWNRSWYPQIDTVISDQEISSRGTLCKYLPSSTTLVFFMILMMCITKNILNL